MKRERKCAKNQGRRRGHCAMIQMTNNESTRLGRDHSGTEHAFASTTLAARNAQTETPGAHATLANKARVATRSHDCEHCRRSILECILGACMCVASMLQRDRLAMHDTPTRPLLSSLSMALLWHVFLSPAAVGEPALRRVWGHLRPLLMSKRATI